MPTARSVAAGSCPHCGALAMLEPHAALGFRCAVCGGPRLALDVPEVQLGSPATSEATADADPTEAPLAHKSTEP